MIYDWRRAKKDWTFDQMVEYWAGQIAISIANGQFKTVIRNAMSDILVWKELQSKNKK